ncbi:EAL domain-containing protein [Alkalilimnicola sp. S0819]|uniref:EAL domain-containing protein n=1 Tax=Alkalilimnicola sp. S0819 TaxID=2613922 RepID=UPI0012629C94|nr:EAL domain-containing protein [Alkalilimnicola sp. S0819]KAB7627580.1 EAL domain-containing protein [Alkalilimnicola sp. S0819]MPQ15741.1 EAL domain-containing protein [Alkalilimnicola sp. S0819]
MLSVAEEYQEEAAYRALVEALDEMGEGLMIIQDRRFVFVNQALCRLCGYREDELMAMPLFTGVFHLEDRDRILANWRRRIDGEQFSTRYETMLQHRDGSPIAAEISVSVLRRGADAATVVTVRDIRERRRTQIALQEQQQRLEALLHQRTAELAQEQRWSQATLESVSEAVLTTDARHAVSYMNPAAEALLGWPQEACAGLRVDQVLRLEAEDDSPPVELLGQLRQLAERGSSNHPGLLRPRLGEPIAVELSLSAIRDTRAGNVGAVIVLRDVSEQRRLTRKLSHQACHDGLTGLVNRMEFERRLDALVRDARDGHTGHALCYLDLDQFKLVNDTCGHSAGDELLRQLSRVLAERVRRSDTLARLGGDEFAILLRDCSPQAARRTAEDFIDLIRQFRFSWQGRNFVVGASLGLVMLDADVHSGEEALRAADASCYLAKDAGRNRLHLFRPNDAQVAQRRGQIQWVTELRKALDQDCFTLFYQPIVKTDDPRHTTCWELLLRLEDGQGGLIAPGAFIPAAERYNLMPEIDRMVISRALRWLSQCRQSPPLISINLSGASVSDPRTIHHVEQVLAETGVEAQRICFEITETHAIANLNQARGFMQSLQALGCSFALDDFGSGMSSFAYLKQLPVRYLKIDGEFVRNILHDPVDHAMLDAIVRVGRAVGRRTVAEFVEDEATLQALRELGVDYSQGYGIARPAPLPV